MLIVPVEALPCSSLLNYPCVNTCIHHAVCIGVGMWVYLCENIRVHTQRHGQISNVLCVQKVKLFKER